MTYFNYLLLNDGVRIMTDTLVKGVGHGRKVQEIPEAKSVLFGRGAASIHNEVAERARGFSDFDKLADALPGLTWDAVDEVFQERAASIGIAGRYSTAELIEMTKERAEQNYHLNNCLQCEVYVAGYSERQGSMAVYAYFQGEDEDFWHSPPLLFGCSPEILQEHVDTHGCPYDPEVQADLLRAQRRAQREWAAANAPEILTSEKGNTIEMTMVVPSGQITHENLGPIAKAQRTGPKVGRNDPCPCGSGRKHKKCCQGVAA